LFERDHHRRVATVLHALDAALLADNGCLFGGGTAMALRYGEYRESVDIDFLVSDRAGYRAMRQRLGSAEGVNAITRPGAHLAQLREVRADQYGLRTLLDVQGAAIKFEVVLEGRIALDPPEADDRLCGVATLTPLDMAASKLLANSDRWADDAVYSRDLIDLAMMDRPPGLLERSRKKAANAYGNSIDTDLARAIQALKERPHRLIDLGFELQINGVPKALLWKRIRALTP